MALVIKFIKKNNRFWFIEKYLLQNQIKKFDNNKNKENMTLFVVGAINFFVFL